METLKKTLFYLAVGAVFLALVVFVAWPLLTVLTGLEVFNYLYDLIVKDTTLKGYFAKALAALFVAVLLALPFVKIYKSFTPLPLKDKSLYRAFPVIVLAAFFFLMGILESSKNNNESRDNKTTILPVQGQDTVEKKTKEKNQKQKTSFTQETEYPPFIEEVYIPMEKPTGGQKKDIKEPTEEQKKFIEESRLEGTRGWEKLRKEEEKP